MYHWPDVYQYRVFFLKFNGQHIHRYDFVAFVDPDEYLLPRMKVKDPNKDLPTLQQLFQRQNKKSKPKVYWFK